jgi:F-type H+-transporting ATPase subunit b
VRSPRSPSTSSWLASLAFALAIGWGGASLAAEPPPGSHATESAHPTTEAADPTLEHSSRIGEDATEHGAEPLHGEEEHSAGMPQLDTRTFPSQIFWLVITFVTLYYLLRRKALPRVEEILEARQDRIASDLDRAARLREEAEAAQGHYEKVVSDTRFKALDALKAVQERVAADTSRRQAELDAELAGQIGEAETRIRAERDRALTEIEDVAAEVARTAVERLAGFQVSEAEARQALSRVLAEAS